MPSRGPFLRLICALAAIAATECGGPTPDLSASLKGIDKAKFLSCSGPPVLEYPTAGQDRMSFVTNLKRGSTIGIAGPGALAPESCNVDAVFQNDKLASSNFSGNLSMCSMVFAPCLQK